MAAVIDRAICIGQRKYSESSQIVTFFGASSGKIRAIAKGSRREKGKYSGGVDILAEGEVVYVPSKQGSGLATLTEFTLSESFAKLRGNLLAMQCGQFMVAMVSELTEDYDPHEKLFDILHLALEALGRSDRSDMLLVRFEMALLREVGLGPVWQCCCVCNGVLDGRVYFSSGAGGMICRDCESEHVEKRRVTPEVLAILQEPKRIKEAKPAAVVATHELLCYHQRELIHKETAIMRLVGELLRKSIY